MGLNLSNLGSAHTLISLIAIASGLFDLFRYGKITPQSSTGKLYYLTTIITCFTSFGLSKLGGFNPGHAVAILVLACLSVGWILEAKQIKFGKEIQTLALSFSFFLSLVPATLEVLTRLPVGAPWAAGPQDPLVAGFISFWFVLFLVGSFLQLRTLRTLTN
ncbi:hypothetical protein [Bdellovibrio sp. BCCA]|uniref:hypothetical protein n=1 Tax=Bdellovibrio sp. BCCA TaxID=3136281 RepID=UPI0030F1E62C